MVEGGVSGCGVCWVGLEKEVSPKAGGGAVSCAGCGVWVEFEKGLSSEVGGGVSGGGGVSFVG